MIKLNIKLNNKYVPLYFKVKDIKAVKVVNNKTHIFIDHAGFILGKHFICKESPTKIGKLWVDDLTEHGKGDWY